MFCVVEHPVSRRVLANGREERRPWPPAVVSAALPSAAAATAAAQLEREHGAAVEVCEIVSRPQAGVAIVRPVIRLLGGFGRGDAYEAEYWG